MPSKKELKKMKMKPEKLDIAILKKNGEIYEPEQDKYKVIGG